MKLIEEYQIELDNLRKKMIKSQNFAKEIPSLSEVIIKNKITGEQKYIELGKNYKKLYLAWGINLVHFNNSPEIQNPQSITNYKGQYNIKLFSIYFNTCSLYDSSEKYGIDELAKIDGVFYYDIPNSHFYVEICAIGDFLDKANEWYLQAIEKENVARKVKQKAKLEKELEALKD